VLLAGAYPALIALIGLGIGALVRHTAGAICALVGVLFVLPLLFISPSLPDAAQNFLPHAMANSMTAVKPLAHALPPALLFALLCVYAVAALAAGAWALTRRDA
jgi:ABC-2 type transport system permease protein